MSNVKTETVACSCGKEHQVDLAFSINITQNPELESKIQNHEFNTMVCDECGKTTIIEGTLLLLDMENQWMIQTKISRPEANYDFIGERKRFMEEIRLAEQMVSETQPDLDFSTKNFNHMVAGSLYELGALIRAIQHSLNPAAIQFLGQIIKSEKTCPQCSHNNTAIYFLGTSDDEEQLVFLLNCMDCTKDNYYYYTFPIQKYHEIEPNLNAILNDSEKIEAMYPNLLNFNGKEASSESNEE